jgi:hypothetical protein
MGERLIAKKDIYAEVEEEGGKIPRLVAAKGQPVPAGYADLVDDADVTTETATTRIAADTVVVDVEEEDGVVIPRQVAVAGQPVPAAFEGLLDDDQVTVVEHEPEATPNEIATQAAATEGAAPEIDEPTPEPEPDAGKSQKTSNVGRARQRKA